MEAVEADHLPGTVSCSCIGLYRPAARVQGDDLVQRVQLAADEARLVVGFRRTRSTGRSLGGPGQEPLQAQEVRGPGAHDPRLSKDDGGALAGLQGTAAVSENKKGGGDDSD